MAPGRKDLCVIEFLSVLRLFTRIPERQPARSAKGVLERTLSRFGRRHETVFNRCRSRLDAIPVLVQAQHQRRIQEPCAVYRRTLARTRAWFLVSMACARL